MVKKNTAQILTLILVFGLLLRLLFFIGVTSGDDLGYYQFAYELTQGKFNPAADYHSVRIGLIYPTALFYKLFGINEFTSNLLPLITSISFILLIFYLGREMFDERTGLIAAFLLSFFPLHVFYSTVLFPDLPSAFFVGLGVFLFFKAEHKKLNINYLACGVCIGIAYLMKELSVLIFIFFVIHILYTKSSKKEHILILLGFLIIFSIETTYYTIMTSNPLYRYEVANLQQAYITKTFHYNYLANLPSRLFLHYPYILLTEIGKFFYVPILFSIVYLTLKKNKKILPSLFWIVPIFIYLNFGSSSLTEYIPLPVGTRYTDIITAPSLLILGYFLSQNEPLIKRYIKPAVILILLISSIYLMYVYKQKDPLNPLRDAKHYLELMPQKKVYTDQRSAEILKYLFGYKRNSITISYNNYDVFKDENTVLNLSNLHDVYVIVNNGMINALLDVYTKMEFPKDIHNPPNNWIVVETYGAGEDKLVIYYAK